MKSFFSPRPSMRARDKCLVSLKPRADTSSERKAMNTSRLLSALSTDNPPSRWKSSRNLEADFLKNICRQLKSKVVLVQVSDKTYHKTREYHVFKHTGKS
jgi:hypothetical protein